MFALCFICITASLIVGFRMGLSAMLVGKLLERVLAKDIEFARMSNHPIHPYSNRHALPI